MNADLEHLIRLQQLDTDIENARRRIGEIPDVQQALDERLQDQHAIVDGIKQRLAASQTSRREIEKEVASLQTRLSKYKDQLMEVKTNKEYQAMQKEIATAEEAVRSQEDRILEHMEEAEVLGRELKTAEADLKRQEAEIAAERKTLDAEKTSLEHRVAEISDQRGGVAKQLSPAALNLFEHVSRQRKGLALAEARDGHCMVCHVRLRPQVYNEVRRNESLIQCETCLRILYYSPSSQVGPDGATPEGAATQAS